MFGKLFGRNKVMDRKAFGQAIMDLVRADPQVKNVQLDVQDFALIVTHEDDGESKRFLENGYRHYAASGMSVAERQTALNEWVISIAAMFNDVAITADGLFPLVRHIGYLVDWADRISTCFEAAGPLPDDYDGPLVQPFVGDLVIILGYDAPTQVSFVTQAALDEVGMTAQQAWDHAECNLSADRPNSLGQVHEDGLMAMEFTDQAWLTPSLLLFPDEGEPYAIEHA